MKKIFCDICGEEIFGINEPKASIKINDSILYNDVCHPCFKSIKNHIEALKIKQG